MSIKRGLEVRFSMASLIRRSKREKTSGIPGSVQGYVNDKLCHGSVWILFALAFSTRLQSDWLHFFPA